MVLRYCFTSFMFNESVCVVSAELSLVRVPQVIFELNRSDGGERKSTVDVRKLTWDFDEMKYKANCSQINKGSQSSACISVL